MNKFDDFQITPEKKTTAYTSSFPASHTKMTDYEIPIYY
jgi:hypothetical protein